MCFVLLKALIVVNEKDYKYRCLNFLLLRSKVSKHPTLTFYVNQTASFVVRKKEFDLTVTRKQEKEKG